MDLRICGTIEVRTQKEVLMNYAIILHNDTAADRTKQNQVIDQVRKTPGVLKVDTEIADSGLLLVQLASSTDLDAIRTIDGVHDLEKMGVKHTM